MKIGLCSPRFIHIEDIGEELPEDSRAKVDRYILENTSGKKA